MRERRGGETREKGREGREGLKRRRKWEEQSRNGSEGGACVDAPLAWCGFKLAGGVEAKSVQFLS